MKPPCYLYIILGGDFNININQNNSKTAEFLNLFLEHNFTQHIKQPTHVTENSSSCLDLIFTNFKHNSLYTSVKDLGFSDHMATILQMSIPPQKTQTNWYTYKSIYTENNINKFKENLKHII